MTVYILFNGSYSDTRVVGVYSSHANAQMAARLFRDDANIEEHEVDPQVENMRRDYEPWFVRLNRTTGNVIEMEIRDNSYGVFSPEVGLDVNDNLCTTCWASNRAHAIKIASERRRAFLAGEPLPPDAVDPQAQHRES